MKTKVKRKGKFNTRKLVERIRKAAGSMIFYVKFRKRTDGTIREMRCRFGKIPTKHEGTGATKPYDPLDYGLLVVWDMDAEGYRSIPLENLITATVRGVQYKGPEPDDG